MSDERASATRLPSTPRTVSHDGSNDPQAGPWNTPCAGGFSNAMCAICDMGEGKVPTHYRDINGWCTACVNVGVEGIKFAATLAAFPLAVVVLYQVGAHGTLTCERALKKSTEPLALHSCTERLVLQPCLLLVCTSKATVPAATAHLVS